MSGVIWTRSHRADEKSRLIADRHYNRQKIGSPQFVPPGRCLVLHAETATGRAFWVTSYPFAQYVKHAWAGSWVCSAFRNENAGQASELILQAVAATRAVFGEPPPQGMITFIDRRKVRPTKVRGLDTWGWTYRKAGFQEVGFTKKDNLLALQLLPDAMPIAAEPLPFSTCKPKSRITKFQVDAWNNNTVQITLDIVCPTETVLATTFALFRITEK